ncbi:hypothetical protein [Mesorhizobium kowhaii]|uniref:hypothetical protein n=1 Tax=Mesorhizobium kowhaii TaxID=1300272 RepID=UPI001FE04F76|nr:hypothetical protein [Mesorhizobium kowhaii]
MSDYVSGNRILRAAFNTQENRDMKPLLALAAGFVLTLGVFASGLALPRGFLSPSRCSISPLETVLLTYGAETRGR